MKLHPENLLAAGEASSYEAMMTVLATGRAAADDPGTTSPHVLGDTFRDLVYTAGDSVPDRRYQERRRGSAGRWALPVSSTWTVAASRLKGEAAAVAASPWAWRKRSR